MSVTPRVVNETRRASIDANALSDQADPVRAARRGQLDEERGMEREERWRVDFEWRRFEKVVQSLGRRGYDRTQNGDDDG